MNSSFVIKMWSTLAIILVFSQVICGVPINRSANITLEEIIFQLNTKDNGGYRLIPYDLDSLQLSGFMPNEQLKVIIHGFMDDTTNSVFTLPSNAFLSLNEKINVLGVDWSACSKNILYEQVVECAKNVGDMTGSFLKWLVDSNNISRDKIHVIGHSLGAQGSSFVSNHIIPARLTALDPAGPLFNHVGPDQRVDSSDADFVDVIHTSAKLLGLVDPIGHVDFYPNGGTDQPGCSDIFGGCAHSTAYQYFAYTITNPNVYQAIECDTLEDARNGTCTGSLQVPMGYATSPDTRGMYYVEIQQVP